jgi:hypothetical protein
MVVLALSTRGIFLTFVRFTVLLQLNFNNKKLITTKAIIKKVILNNIGIWGLIS